LLSQLRLQSDTFAPCHTREKAAHSGVFCFVLNIAQLGVLQQAADVRSASLTRFRDHLLSSGWSLSSNRSVAGCGQRAVRKMSASAPDAHAHTAAFSSRAAAVFGALSAGTGQPAWSLSRETVFKAGKAADYSSDEEVQAAVAEKWREETLPSDLLDLAGQCLQSCTLVRKRSQLH